MLKKESLKNLYLEKIMIRNNRTQDFFTDWQNRIMVEWLICLLAIGVLTISGWAMDKKLAQKPAELKETQANHQSAEAKKTSEVAEAESEPANTREIQQKVTQEIQEIETRATKGKITKTVNVIYFFPKTEFQNPGKTVPNWYYYWSNTACSFIRGNSYPWGGGAYNSGPFAKYNGNWANPVYTLYNRATDAEKYNYSYGGVNLNIDRKGIDTLEATLEHEREHQRTDEKRLSPTGIWNGKTDTDGDELPDDWENQHASLGFDPNDPYSFPNFPYGDDEEVWCELQAQGKKGNASQDWAWPGKQSDPPF